MKRLVLILSLAAAALSGCQFDEPTLGGTILSVTEAERGERPEPSPKTYDDPLVPEVAWQVEVRLDDGAVITIETGSERRTPGERVRVLKSEDNALLL